MSRNKRKRNQQAKKKDPIVEITVGGEKIAPDHATDLVLKASIGKAFNEKQKAQEIKDPNELFMFMCRKKHDGKECGNIHFRHAGYIETMAPFVNQDQKGEVVKASIQVMVCTVCKSCYVWVNQKMYDVTKHVDLNAWEKTEKEMEKATGPGGDC